MSDVADKLLRAIRDAQPDDETPTRLATVTGGTNSTLLVRFDGEATASTRQYPLMFTPVRVGDRVVMLRVGSTWVVAGRVGVDVAESYTPGDFSGTLSSNSSVVRREGRNVHLHVDIRHGASGVAANARVLAVGQAPGVSVYNGGVLNRDTGGAVGMYVSSDGYLQYVFAAAAGSGVLGTFNWILP